MTVIKAREATGHVGGYRAARPSMPGSPEAVRAADCAMPGAHEDSECESTSAAERIAALQRSLQAKESEVIAVREAALEEGRQLGRAEATERQAERLQALEQALSDAVTAITDQMTVREEQAVVIAKAALARILGERSRFGEMVAETAGLWRQRLAETTILRVIVSPEDFADAGDLAALQLRLGTIEIVADPKFASGECRFALAMGEVDVSLPRQAAAVERLLADHAVESVVA